MLFKAASTGFSESCFFAISSSPTLPCRFHSEHSRPRLHVLAESNQGGRGPSSRPMLIYLVESISSGNPQHSLIL